MIGEIRISHLTPVLCLLAALVWRYRDSTVRPGLALGLAGAVKFFLWPLGLWLLALRNARAALLAAVVAAASLLLVLPFTGLDEFARLMVDLGERSTRTRIRRSASSCGSARRMPWLAA